MEILRLDESLLNGKLLHCQPVEGGPVVEARIIPASEELPTVKVIIACPARRAGSKCELLIRSKKNHGHCLYYKGDSLGLYQIIGPEMHKKSDIGYKNV